jgi:hypothetical protein
MRLSRVRASCEKRAKPVERDRSIEAEWERQPRIAREQAIAKYVHQYQCDECLKSVNEIRPQTNIRIVLISISLLTACGLAHIKPDTQLIVLYWLDDMLLPILNRLPAFP